MLSRFFATPDTSYTVAPKTLSSIDLSGKHGFVVGGTNGLGRAIALLAASKGAKVTVVGRSFRDENVANLAFIKADLSLVSEAEKVAAKIPADSDFVILTTGILAPKERQLSGEGIEIDMAVSALSRYVILENLAPRMLATSHSGRVFVMGFPGNNQLGDYTDPNSDKKYEGGLGLAHMNTVAANEALVHSFSAKSLPIYGLNPGLIATGIRDNLHGGTKTWSGWLMETVTGWMCITPEKYAENVLPLLVAPELEQHKGGMFNQSGHPILPSKDFTKDNVLTNGWMKALEGLRERAKKAGEGK